MLEPAAWTKQPSLYQIIHCISDSFTSVNVCSLAEISTLVRNWGNWLHRYEVSTVSLRLQENFQCWHTPFLSKSPQLSVKVHTISPAFPSCWFCCTRLPTAERQFASSCWPETNVALFKRAGRWDCACSTSINVRR